MSLPPVPPWAGFHVLVVHFPVALLLVAPLLMLMALFVQRKMPGFGAAAWVVLLLGTIAAWVAVNTGIAAYNETGEMTDAARAVMERHGEMGVVLRNIVTGLCAAYGVVLLVPVMFKRVKAVSWRTAGTLIVLLGYGWTALYLSNAAHLGGRLVHEYGVRAPVSEGPPEASAGPNHPSTKP